MSKIILTYTDKPKKISEALLKGRLVACVNILPVKSQYWWKGKIEKNKEAMLIIKTSKNNVDKVVKKIEKLHTYEVPVIDVIDAEMNSKAEKWLKEVD